MTNGYSYMMLDAARIAQEYNQEVCEGERVTLRHGDDAGEWVIVRVSRGVAYLEPLRDVMARRMNATRGS